MVNLHCGTLVLFLKEAKAATFLKISRYNLHVNGRVNSVFKFKCLGGCVIDVLYDLRRILALTVAVFGRFYLRERLHDPVSVTRIAFEDKIMAFRIT